MRIAVLTPPLEASGRADLDDTFRQAEEIATALDALGHEAFPAIFSDDRAKAAAALRHVAPDLVFNLVEDVPEGPDQVHLATALLDALGLRHTGASTAALAALGDKRQMKAVLRKEGLPVAGDVDSAGATTRLIVKSAIEHASVGLSDANVVTGVAAAGALIDAKTATHGGTWFAEAYIDGREFNVALLDGRVLPIAEILFTDHSDGRPKIVGYAEKWDSASDAYATTPRAFPTPEEPLFSELARLSLAAWELFELGGYARVDFRVDAAGQPVILEINANPCLAADAGFCAAAAKIGLSQNDVVATVLNAAG